MVFRALWSQLSFYNPFLEKYFRFPILDIYKCPFSKTPRTFYFCFVTENLNIKYSILFYISYGHILNY